MNKEKENYPFDESLADWLKRSFPKSVSSKNVAQWRFHNKMPNWAYHQSVLTIHDIPINYLMLLEGITLKELIKEMPISATSSSYLIAIFKGEQNPSEKIMNFLNQKFIAYKDKKTLVPHIPVISLQHFIIEYEEIEKVYVRAVHIFRTRNGGKAHFCKSVQSNGLINSNDGVVDGKTVEEILSNPRFVEVEKFKQLQRAMAKVNRPLSQMMKHLK